MSHPTIILCVLNPPLREFLVHLQCYLIPSQVIDVIQPKIILSSLFGIVSMYSSAWFVSSNSSVSKISSFLFRFFNKLCFNAIAAVGLPVILTVPSGFFPRLPLVTESVTIMFSSFASSLSFS